MPGERDEFSGWWCFDSVQELWDAAVLEDSVLRPLRVMTWSKAYGPTP